MTVWVAGAIFGIITLLAGTLKSSPPFYVKLSITLSFPAAALLALVRVGFEFKKTKLERKLSVGLYTHNDELRGEDLGWPEQQEAFWWASPRLIFLSALVILVGLWREEISVCLDKIKELLFPMPYRSG